MPQANDAPAQEPASPYIVSEESETQKFNSVPQTSQEAIDLSVRTRGASKDDAGPSENAMEGSTCSSSAMDESTGSVDDVEDQSYAPEITDQMDYTDDRPEPVVSSSSSASPHETPTPSGQSLGSKSNSPDHQPVDNSRDLNTTAETHFSPEPSIGSDTYEPPEPEETEEIADTPKSASTPPFSPPPPEPVENAKSEHPLPLHQDVEKLISTNQDKQSELLVATQVCRESPPRKF